MKFDKLPTNAFQNMQMGAGMLLNKFDPTGTTPIKDEDSIGATKGGVTITVTSSYTDMGEDVDNAPKNMKEFKNLESIECKIAGTLLDASLVTIKMQIGAADIDTATGKVTPRGNLKQSDFQDIWWVGNKTDGGMMAIKLINALSTGGFSLKTTDKQKGEFAFEMTGHVSLASQDVMPIEIYVADAERETVSAG